MADTNGVVHERDAEQPMFSGFLYKSPPENKFKNLKSWKRRYFILSRNGDDTCQMKYYKSPENNKELGEIHLMKVTLMFLYPETHAMWKWIHQNFRCSASNVMFLRAAERDYFLIGENSWEMERWFSLLFHVLNHRPHELLDRKDTGTKRNIGKPPQTTNHSEQKAKWESTSHITLDASSCQNNHTV